MTDLTEFNLEEAIALLSRMPGTLDALLRGLPDVWVRGNEGEDTWSAFDIIGHMAFAERSDWMPRVRMILEHGDGHTFRPFDRFAQKSESQGKSLEQLLDDFSKLRQENLTALEELKLTPEDLRRPGRHPVFGPVRLSELLATWTVHDQTHLHQISRVMAYPYRNAVGPWSAYLGVLRCMGHSVS